MTVLEDTRDEDSTEGLTSGWDTDWDNMQPPDDDAEWNENLDD